MINPGIIARIFIFYYCNTYIMWNFMSLIWYNKLNYCNYMKMIQICF